MNRFPAAQDLYRIVTSPYRGWCLRQLRKQHQVPVTGLFLHRVADEHPNDWTISIRGFDTLLDWLQQHVDLVSLEEAQRRIRKGNHERVAVHLSFDDGYADNCLHAVPELLRRKIPFTYFVSTDFVERGKPFPHDVARKCPLAPNSVDEIKAMCDAGVELGTHTRTHPDVATIVSESRLMSELSGARDDLEAWTGVRPRYFAFPYGLPQNISPQSVQKVFDLGYDGFCSAHGGYNRPCPKSTSLDVGFHLCRFHFDPLLARVRNWLTLAPHALRRVSPTEELTTMLLNAPRLNAAELDSTPARTPY